MILNKCNFFSKTLLNHVDVDILLPGVGDNDCVGASLEDIYAPQKPFPVLYLLHGALDDHTMWLRHTNIEEFAEKAGLAVVMPSGQNGFYTNAKYGLNYFDFITKELPLFVQKYFPVSTKREDTYIAGPSMGGYGAAKCALRRPDLYAAFADLSGAVDPVELEPKMIAMGFGFFRYDLIWGGVENMRDTLDDPYFLAKQFAPDDVRPEAFIYCGLEDVANYGMNCRLRDTLADNGFAVHFQDGHGLHDWEYWNRCIEDFLKNIQKMRTHC